MTISWRRVSRAVFDAIGTHVEGQRFDVLEPNGRIRQYVVGTDLIARTSGEWLDADEKSVFDDNLPVVGDTIAAGAIFVYAGVQYSNDTDAAFVIPATFPTTPVANVNEYIGSDDFNITNGLLGQPAAPLRASEVIKQSFDQRYFKSPHEGPDNFNPIDLRNLETRVHTVLNKTIPNNAFTLISWDSLGEDTLGGLYNVFGQTTLTIPAHLDGDIIEVEVGGDWEFNATGQRRLEIIATGAGVETHYNRIDTKEGLASVTPTVSQAAKWRGRVTTGATIQARVYQASGVDLNFNGGAHLIIKVVRRRVGKEFNAIANVPQGDYSLMAASPEAHADQWAKAAVNIITHPPYPEETGSTLQGLTGVPSCLDAVGTTDWKQLVIGGRRKNPLSRYFSYAAPTIDAPNTNQCGYDFIGGPEWFPVNNDLPGFRKVIEFYAAMPAAYRPDGIFLDIIAPFTNGGWINAEIRDLAYSICREHGFYICANTTNPSFINLDFAVQGLGKGDMIMAEGFELIAGVPATAVTRQFMDAFKNYRHTGVTLMALATSALNTTPTQAEIDQITASFLDQAFPGDVLAIHPATLDEYVDYDLST